MNATLSLKIFDITQYFSYHKKKAREFVAKIEEVIDIIFNIKKNNLASKLDLTDIETRVEKNFSYTKKTLYIIGLMRFIAIIGSVLAIVNFMLKWFFINPIAKQKQNFIPAWNTQQGQKKVLSLFFFIISILINY